MPKKNLRLVGGKPLAQWVAKSCVEAEVFDEIYINSEALIFERLAQESGVRFYHRPAALASNEATNDEFGLDFMNKVSCDFLVQVNPTSPFTPAAAIREFTQMLVKDNYDTLLTVEERQVEGWFDGIPLNFDPEKQMPPSQLLKPVRLHSSNILAWRTAKFRENMSKYGCAVYGGDGRTGFYVVNGLATVDIDNEADFQLAEQIAEMRTVQPSYYEQEAVAR